MINEVLTLFAGRTDPAQVIEALRRLAPDVQVESDDGGWRVATVSRSRFFRRKTLQLNNDPDYWSEPNWSRQKDGMRGFIGRFPGIHRVPKAFELINGLAFAVGARFEPGYDAGDERLEILRQVAASIDGVLFTGSGFTDAHGRTLFGADADPDADAVWPACCIPNEPVRTDPEQIRRVLDGLPPEVRDRKQRSETLLAAQGVGMHPLLHVCGESEMRRRDTREIVIRMLCVLAAAMHGEGVGQGNVKGFVADKGIATSLTPEEVAFIAVANPDQQARLKFGWRYECAWVLLWALGLIDELEPPTHICTVTKMGDIVRGRDIGQLVRDARPRSAAEILDQADLSLRYHWAAVEARLRGGTLPPQFDPGVIFERHYAFNWLIDAQADDWDSVEVNT